ncbi:hypothetical protein TNCV_3046091 [Trichonephila clavipes]|uniref:Uncharacterized protein n=1 Tax=Trichonephila clavipes TaxID=2585209 RepID=A0A8X6RTS1_TRICX|nr:hypothetical protein TNCV_3046091 [Trichonephila clavipes]
MRKKKYACARKIRRSEHNSSSIANIYEDRCSKGPLCISRSYAFADPRSLSHVPQMWTCVVCQQFAGCLIDDRYAKLRAHDPRSLQFWLLLGVQNRVRRRPPPGPP